MMEYIKVIWFHDLLDEPRILYSELNEDRMEIRKVEVYGNGFLGFADSKKHTNNTELSITPIPSVEEIEKEREFDVFIINKEEFEEKWIEAILG